MLQILSITSPIFLIIALGYFAVRIKLVPKNDIRALGGFVINFALPSLLFKALSERDFAEIINVTYLCAYGGGALIMMMIGVCYARFVQKKPLAKCALEGMGMSMSNSGFVGYPVALQLLGPVAAVPLALCMLIENLVMFPIGLVLAESSDPDEAKRHKIILRAFARLGKSPIIIAIVAGFILALIGIKLPAPVSKAVDMMAQASGALALFVIGGTLVGLRLRGLRADVGRIVASKLILHPLAVFSLVMILPPMDPVLQTAAVSFACSPMLSIFPILGQRYDHQDLCAAALMVATSLSFVTISTALWLLDVSRVFGVPG